MKVIVNKNDFPNAIKAETPVRYLDVREGKLEDYRDKKMPWHGGPMFIDYWNSEGKNHLQIGNTFTRERECSDVIYYIEVASLDEIKEFLKSWYYIELSRTQYIGYDFELRRI